MLKIRSIRKLSLFPIMAAILTAPMLAGCSTDDLTCRDLRITNPSFPDGVVGIPYADLVTVESNCQWWKIEGRNFVEFRAPYADQPPGVDMDAMGVITGIPTMAGVFPFTITAINITHMVETKRDYTITIRDAAEVDISLYYLEHLPEPGVAGVL
ncbi:MAG: hypothetical protein OEZ32_11980 [Nitrospinota bacterium]|nr:hypothetical protein [Nitrospinota bacterium]